MGRAFRSHVQTRGLVGGARCGSQPKHDDMSQETGQGNDRHTGENGDIQNLVVSIRSYHCGGKIKH